MNKNRFIRMVALAGCSVLIGALGYSSPATAHIGSSHAPFTTQRVDLRSATFQSGPGNIKACFDQPATLIAGGEVNAFLEGYDANTRLYAFVAGTGSQDVDPNCILLSTGAGANPPSSVTFQTIFKVNTGLVTGAAGQQNTPGAVQLDGTGTPNLDHTDALELQSAMPVPGGFVDYTFDRPPDNEAAVTTANSFGYQTAAGDVGTCRGTVISSFTGNTIRVGGFGGCPAPAAADPSQGVRFFADTMFAGGGPATCVTAQAAHDRGTARNPGGTDDNAKWNPLGVVPVGTAGTTTGDTDDPDMTVATKAGPNTVDATFDEAIVNSGGGVPNPLCAMGFEADGDVHVATTAVVTNPGGASTTVRYTFPSLPTHQMQIFGVLPGAATSSVTAGEPNSYGIQEFSDRLQPGFSDAGDLEQVTTNNPQDQATFCFDTDEILAPGSVAAPAHQILDASGSVIGTGTGVVGTSGFCTTIQFPANVVNNAVAGGLNAVGETDDVGTVLHQNAATVTPPATEDPSGLAGPGTGANASVMLAHVAVNAAPPTGAPPGPTPPPTPPPTTPPGPPTVTTGLCDSSRPTANLAEILIGTAGPDNICGFGGDDLLRMRGGGDQGRGGPGDDTVAGQRGKDTARGGPGNDILRGGKGNDNARGGSGDDTMAGGRGNDTLRGGKGKDSARGGKGRRDLCRAESQRGCEN